MQAFIEYYENHHVPLIRSLAPTPILYNATLMLGDEISVRDGAIAFDGATEVRFCDRAAYPAGLGHLSAAGSGAVGVDEERFLDRSRTRAHLVEEHVTSG